MRNETNTGSDSSKKNMGCPCDDMNSRYAKGFDDDDDAFVEEDITLEEDSSK